MKKYFDDILILAGCGLVIYATSLLSGIAALYVAGFMLIGLGVLVALGDRRGE